MRITNLDSRQYHGYLLLTNSFGCLYHSSGGNDLKYSYVIFNPSLRLTVGSQPNNSFAFVISGCLCFGSSTGNGLYMIFCEVPVNLMTSSANSFKVISEGFPTLT